MALTRTTAFDLPDGAPYWVEAFGLGYSFNPSGVGPTTVTYALAETGTTPNGQAYRPLSDGEIANIEASIDRLTSDNGLTLVETDATSAQLLIGASSDPDDTAYGRTWQSTSGPVHVVAYDQRYDSAEGLANNSYIYLHELLHAVGFAHSTAAFGSTLPVVIPDTEDDGTTLFGRWSSYWTQSLQLFDLAAMQYLYGPDPAARTGDDTYAPDLAAFDPDFPDENVPLLWDGGGQDTIDLSFATGPVDASLAPGVISRVATSNTGLLEAGTFAINHNSVFEVLQGGAFDDTLGGGDLDDNLRGGAGDDSLLGGLGNDTLAGGTGADTLSGGAGIDTAVMAATRAETTVALDGTAVLLTAGGKTSRLENIERVTFADQTLSMTDLTGVETGNSAPQIGATGSPITVTEGTTGTILDVALSDGYGHAIWLTLDGPDADLFQLSGAELSFVAAPDFEFPGDTGGDNVYDVTLIATDSEGASSSTDLQIVVSDGDDPTLAPGQLLVGGDAPDTLDGTDGADTIAGGGGNDVLGGGAGNDNISGSTGNDVIFGGDGDDRIGGGTEDDTINAGDGNDTVGAGQGNDQANGGAGNDVVNGGAGDDSLTGSGGNDTMGASFGNDLVSGNDGDDDLGGGAGQDFIIAGAGNDKVGGGEANDTILGEAGNDFLAGGGRDDEIDGGAGDDTINGGNGDDTMVGGTGADLFVFRGFNNGDADVIVDFEDGIDLFRVSGVQNAPGSGQQGKLDALNISDVAGGVRITYEGHEITVEGIAAADLTLSDFIFV